MTPRKRSMPHLHRPETDKQRYAALTAAKAKYETTAAPLRAFSTATYNRLVVFLPIYKAKLQQRSTALSQQAKGVSVIGPKRRMLRLYIGHFIIGLDNAILRQELPASVRAYYQLPTGSRTLPKLTTDDDLLLWAQRVVNGEDARIAAGGAALTNPTATQVNDQLIGFEPLVEDLSTRKTAYDDAQEAVAALWPEADELLKDIWDEVLFHFRKDDPPSLRRKAREWGLVYKDIKQKAEEGDNTGQ